MTIREAPQEWRDLLGHYGRGTDRLGHLDIWYDPDVERWLLVEFVPRALVPADVVTALELNPLASRFRIRQSQALRETGKLPVAFFIIQGDKGGHKLHYSPVERELAMWYTGSAEPPPAGALPYAPFDQRVLDQLRRLDWLHTTYQTYEAAANGDMTEALRRMRAEVLEYTDEALSEAIEEAMPALMDADLPVVDAPPPDYDALAAQYVETGDIDAPGGALRAGPSVTVPFTH